MSGFDAWADAVLCRCGKQGWAERTDATRAQKIMRGRARDKSPRADQISVYRCRQDESHWHVGHDRSRVSS